MSRIYSESEIIKQQALVVELKELEALIGVCRESHAVLNSVELIDVCTVLRMSADRLHDLVQSQSEYTEYMQAVSDESAKPEGGAQ